MARTFTPEEITGLNRKLTRGFESMLTKYSFKPGQLVRWKAGLKNKSLPEYNAPAIVWETLPNPIFDNSKTVVAGSLSALIASFVNAILASHCFGISMLTGAV